MRSHDNGDLSAVTQVKVSSPEILHNAQGKGFHMPEAKTVIRDKGECITACRGLSPQRANQLSILELGRTAKLRKVIFNKPERQGEEKAMR